MIPNNKTSQTQTDLDLLQALFDDEIAYPWNPAQPESEAYFAHPEAGLNLLDCLTDTEISQRSQVLFNQVEQLYTTTALQQILLQKFAEQVPRELLNHLGEQALQVRQKLSNSTLSLADQLVDCVHGILPEWQTEDLYVLARPFAYSMLGTEVETQSSPWSELSEVERARMSLAIARYALSELQSPE